MSRLAWTRLAIAAAFVLGAAACDEPLPSDDGGVVDPTTIHVRFEPDATDFWRTPWPSDARLTSTGAPDMTGFPRRRGLMDDTLSEIEGYVRGYATTPVVYFALDKVVTDASLPENVAATDPASPIQLIDLSEDACGQRVPLEVAFAEVGDSLREDRALQVANAMGTVLTPGHPYGAIVLRTFGRADGFETTARPEAFDRALADTSGSDALSRSLDPLRRCLPTAGVALDDVAVATVFTPQDPVAEMRALRNYVMDPDRTEMRDVGDWRYSEAWSRRRLALTTYIAHVQMPIFQDGETPYELSGGRLSFDGNGVPELQRWEEVDIAVAFGTDAVREGPSPVLVFTDGTGWDPWNHLSSNLVREALSAGYVVCSFMPQFHGGRAGFTGNTEISTFNIPNPPAGRANFRQQAAETSYFTRIIEERITALPGIPEIDPARIVYGGHSQGALVGSILAAVEDRFHGYVLNGLSSNLTQTILFRMDLLDFNSVIKTLYMFTGELDRFHPLVQIIQLGAEVVDPQNYAARWHGWDALPHGNHVFVSNGRMDTTTTARAIEHLTMSASIPPIAPPGWNIDPAGVWTGMAVPLPVSGDAMSVSGDPLTIATYLDPEQGHFTIYRVPFVRELAASFWRTSLDGVPEIASVHEFQCGDGADEDRDGMLDCADPDCATRPPCVEGACDNMIDEDENGLVDCADPVCADNAACHEQMCGDSVDDDGDGATDCEDSDCADDEPCIEKTCTGGTDEDGDGMIDCADPDCARDRACYESSCGNGSDEDGDGMIDCADSDCRMSLRCPEAMCADARDDDGNGLVDCADPGCASDAACARMTETTCNDATDDDGDGAIDCEDADCARFVTCSMMTCANGTLGRQTGIALYRGRIETQSNDYPPGDCTALGAGADTPDVAFAWTAPAAGDYVISTFGSQPDTVLSVVGADCDPATEIACNDDEASTVGSSRVEVTLEADQTVVIVVNAYSADATGEVVLSIWPRSP
ncbi:MAG: hypothetical protein AB7S26_13480 [Sandaracinaceae bacterium]